MLSDVEIKNAIASEELGIIPFTEDQLRPNSYLLRLADNIGVFKGKAPTVSILDPSTFPRIHKVNIGGDGYLILPKQFVLSGTLERLFLSSKIGAVLKNRSGLARLGLSVEISSLVSSGFGSSAPAPLTLELYNFSEQAIRIFAGVPVCHVVFQRLGIPSSLNYDRDIGNHSIQDAPGGSRFAPNPKPQGR